MKCYFTVVSFPPKRKTHLLHHILFQVNPSLSSVSYATWRSRGAGGMLPGRSTTPAVTRGQVTLARFTHTHLHLYTPTYLPTPHRGMVRHARVHFFVSEHNSLLEERRRADDFAAQFDRRTVFEALSRSGNVFSWRVSGAGVSHKTFLPPGSWSISVPGINKKTKTLVVALCLLC